MLKDDWGYPAWVMADWGATQTWEFVLKGSTRAVVALETGNPVAMPWRDDVRAIVQAWYPGQAGGTAIADVLTGKVNPSGHTPITWPASLADTPRPTLPGIKTKWGTDTTIAFAEAPAVGYRWYAKTGREQVYPFGYGLSYTSFEYGDFTATGGHTARVSFTLTNTARVPAPTCRRSVWSRHRARRASGSSASSAISSRPARAGG